MFWKKKNKFKPNYEHILSGPILYSLRIDKNIEESLMLASKSYKIPKQELIRQMIKYCLKDMGYLKYKED